MRNLQALAYTLIIIGALNWGLVGFFAFDLVSFLFGDMSTLTRIIYALIGLSAIFHLVVSTSGYKVEKGAAY